MIYRIVTPNPDSLAGNSKFPHVLEFTRQETNDLRDQKDEIIEWGKEHFGGCYPPFGGGYYRTWGLFAPKELRYVWQAYFMTDDDAFKFRMRWG